MQTYLEQRRRSLKSVVVQVDPEDMQPLLLGNDTGDALSAHTAAIHCAATVVDPATQYEVKDQIAAVELTLENGEEIALEMVA